MAYYYIYQLTNEADAMLSNETVLKAIQDAENRGFNFFGVRQHHTLVGLGEALGRSYNAIDDQEPVELKGTCALPVSYDGYEVDDIEHDVASVKGGNYQSGPIILVAGTKYEHGNDDFEIILENAEVILILEP